MKEGEVKECVCEDTSELGATQTFAQTHFSALIQHLSPLRPPLCLSAAVHSICL